MTLTRIRSKVNLLQQQPAQFLPAVLQSESVSAVHHPHQPVRTLKVVPPVGAQGLLTSNIPDIQLKAGKTSE